MRNIFLSLWITLMALMAFGAEQYFIYGQNEVRNHEISSESSQEESDDRGEKLVQIDKANIGGTYISFHTFISFEIEFPAFRDVKGICVDIFSLYQSAHYKALFRQFIAPNAP